LQGELQDAARARGLNLRVLTWEIGARRLGAWLAHQVEMREMEPHPDMPMAIWRRWLNESPDGKIITDIDDREVRFRTDEPLSVPLWKEQSRYGVSFLDWIDLDSFRGYLDAYYEGRFVQTTPWDHPLFGGAGREAILIPGTVNKDNVRPFVRVQHGSEKYYSVYLPPGAGRRNGSPLRNGSTALVSGPDFARLEDRSIVYRRQFMRNPTGPLIDSSCWVGSGLAHDEYMATKVGELGYSNEVYFNRNWTRAVGVYDYFLRPGDRYVTGNWGMIKVSPKEDGRLEETVVPGTVIDTKTLRKLARKEQVPWHKDWEVERRGAPSFKRDRQDMDIMAEDFDRASGKVSRDLAVAGKGETSHTVSVLGGDGRQLGSGFSNRPNHPGELHREVDPDLFEKYRVHFLGGVDGLMRTVGGRGEPRSVDQVGQPYWDGLSRSVEAAGLEQRLGEILPPYDGAAEDCVVRLEMVRRGLFGGSAVARDDFAVDPRRQKDEFGVGTRRLDEENELAAAVGGQWRPLTGSVGDLLRQVRELPHGAMAFVLTRPPGKFAHGFAVRNENGRLLWVETQGPVRARVSEAGEPPVPVVDGRAIVVDANGRTVSPDGLSQAMKKTDGIFHPSTQRQFGLRRWFRSSENSTGKSTESDRAVRDTAGYREIRENSRFYAARMVEKNLIGAAKEDILRDLKEQRGARNRAEAEQVDRRKLEWAVGRVWAESVGSYIEMLTYRLSRKPEEYGELVNKTYSWALDNLYRRLYRPELISFDLRARYADEDKLGHPDHPGTSLRVKYLNEKEREAYRVAIGEDGLLYDSRGDLYDTDDRFAMFTVDPTGSMIYSGFKVTGQLHHSSFLAGGPASGAGLWMVKAGRVHPRMRVNRSGHYGFDRKTAGQTVHNFRRLGMDLPDHVIEYH
jgi:hypothetical protein